MALAYLKYEGSFGGNHHFTFDLGANRFFKLGVGRETRRSKRSGLRFIDNVYYTTPLKNIPEQALGRGKIVLPNERLQERQSYVQLISYADRKQTGATFSDLISIRMLSSLNGNDGDFTMPELGFSNQQTMNTINIDHKPLTLKEEQYSDAMFIQGLIAAIPGVISAAGPILKGLVSGAGGASGIANIVGSLLGGAGGGLLNGGATATAPAQAGNGRASIDLTSPEFLNLVKTVLEKLPNLSTARAQSQYSEAKVAPALAALIPMLQKVLSPEVMKSIIESPNKMLNTIIDGTAKLDKQDMEHLEKLNPGVDDPSVERILAGMSLMLASNAKAIPFKQIRSVDFDFKLKRAESGKSQSKAFLKGAAIRVPIQVSTPKTLPETIVQVIIKDPEKLTVFVEKKFKVPTLQNGEVLDTISFDAHELLDVPSNKDLLLCLSLVWKNSKGQKIGTQKTTLVTFTSAYMFGHVGGVVGSSAPLNDVNQHRDFWHKVWQADLKGSTRKVTFDTKYIYQLSNQTSRNAQNQTRIKWNNPAEFGEERNVQGKLLSGFEASITLLNQLLPRVSDYPSLSQDQLEALSSDHFVGQSAFSARTQLEFRGRTGDTLALWIFPELQIREIVLKKTAEADLNGQPTAFTEETVHFGLPAAVHFIGVSSDR